MLSHVDKNDWQWVVMFHYVYAKMFQISVLLIFLYIAYACCLEAIGICDMGLYRQVSHIPFWLQQTHVRKVAQNVMAAKVVIHSLILKHGLQFVFSSGNFTLWQTNTIRTHTVDAFLYGSGHVQDANSLTQLLIVFKYKLWFQCSHSMFLNGFCIVFCQQ